MSDWSFDISQAPRGKTVSTEQMRCSSKGEVTVVVETFVPDWLWIATKCGKVLKSHWLPADGKFRPVGRWLNIGSTEQPVAWQSFVVPVHPGLVSSEGEA